MNSKKIKRSKRSTVLFLTQAGVIAAMYVTLTYLSAAAGLAFNAVQFRLSEIMCVFALYTSAAIPGLTIGCIISNISSTLGLIDIFAGSTATLLAALCIYFTRGLKIKNFPVSVPLFSSLFNAVIVGLEIWYLDPSRTAQLFFISALEVAAGEIVVCTIGSLILPPLIKRTKIIKKNHT